MFCDNKIYDVLILPPGYQADDLRILLISIRSSHIYCFPHTVWLSPVQTAHQVKRYSSIRAYMCMPDKVAHTCACPNKAAQMSFGIMNFATRTYI